MKRKKRRREKEQKRKEDPSYSDTDTDNVNRPSSKKWRKTEGKKHSNGSSASATEDEIRRSKQCKKKVKKKTQRGFFYE